MHRTTASLDTFELRAVPLGEGTYDSVVDDCEPAAWIPAVVPGGVHESLLAAGRIEHPYSGANERRADWVQEREWWYRTGFPHPGPGTARLVFDGLDTVADVWLNGRHLGHHENQFRPAAFDVTDALGEDNTLLLRFLPPLVGREPVASAAETIQRMLALMNPGDADGSADTERAETPGEGAAEDTYWTETMPVAASLRKAAFSWGWDFGPHVPSIGIWRQVRLEVAPSSTLTGHHVALTHLADDHSTARVRVTVETTEPGTELSAHVTLRSPSGREFRGEAELWSSPSRSIEIPVDEPELWWTHDLGTPTLHEVVIELRDGDEVVDTVTDSVGLRTLELNRAPDAEEGGRYFGFVLNGVPIFARGANWLPASAMVGSVGEATHRDLVLRATEGNLTMLRVWGGGIYEHDSFYRACDELGVLVWQDFMFANVDYPDHDAGLRHEVELEAEYQVRRLRNRACLALWCGNNEALMMRALVWGHLDEGADGTTGWGRRFYTDVLPGAVAAHDGLTPYWPGSPYGEENGVLSVIGTDDGDRHTWEVWHGLTMPGVSVGPTTFPSIGDARHYRRYADDTAKFVSEFGIHAAPEAATLRRWIPEEDLAVHSPVFDQHNKDHPKNKGDELLAVTTGLPEGLDQYIAFTQAVQAEGMAFGVEHYRRRQPHTAGALMWQYNDVWPGFTWSIVDHDAIPKAAYYTARRASAPVALSFRSTSAGDLELWLANNTRTPARLDVDVELGAFDGSDRTAHRVTAAAAPGASALVWSTTAGEYAADAHHYAWASVPDGTAPSVRKHFAEIKDLRFGPSSLDVSAEPHALRIRATGYAYMVRIEQPEVGMRLSDNAFDLRDGDEVVIQVAGADPASLKVLAFPLPQPTD
ncbi:glycoside hydrolase family 2 protein [Streptomyces parvus]|uniref:glycoside hydrolase family 2 protein n=1 Tax=Streptomyces parvus TaxID=66428 RepID=UPI00362A1DF1